MTRAVSVQIDTSSLCGVSICASELFIAWTTAESKHCFACGFVMRKSLKMKFTRCYLTSYGLQRGTDIGCGALVTIRSNVLYELLLLLLWVFRFQIHSTTGVITVIGCREPGTCIDYESKKDKQYALTVTAQDEVLACLLPYAMDGVIEDCSLPRGQLKNKNCGLSLEGHWLWCWPQPSYLAF